MSLSQPQREGAPPSEQRRCPEIVDLGLGLAVDEERDRRREGEVRAAVEGDERLAFSWKVTDMTEPAGAGAPSP